MENVKKTVKRARCVNFTANEKEILLNLIYKYRHVIENKKTDCVSNEGKAQAWQKIAFEFNASAPNLCRRTAESLKKFYENRKKEIRKQVAEEKKDILLTGGGSVETVVNDPGKELMLSIMNEKTVYGLQNKFGGDSNFLLPSCSKDATNDGLVLELNSENEEQSEDNGEVLYEFEEGMEQIIMQDEVNTNENMNWQKYTPAKLAIPKSDALKQSESICTDTPSKRRKLDPCRRRPTTAVKALTSSDIADKYNKLVDKRIALADYQAKIFENQLKNQMEEHELKVRQLKFQNEEHELRIRQLKYQNEEYEMKNQLLKLDLELKKKQKLNQYKT